MRMLLLIAIALAPLSAEDNEPTSRLHESAEVLSEVMAAPGGGIPLDLLESAHCIVIVPGLKTGAFVFGGKYGKGYLSCRSKSGLAGRRQVPFVLRVAALASKSAAPRPT